jgi:Protein of unknown function (DUF1553)/Protein of unknown function (DUF1549)
MKSLAAVFLMFVIVGASFAEDPLYVRIDTIIEKAAKGQTISAVAEDGEFLRRVTLDLTGNIPTVDITKKFLSNTASDKRLNRINELFAQTDYANHMTNQFHVMWMERLGDSVEWMTYLKESFAINKPWDEMVREMLLAEKEGARFFIGKRLENYGQNPVDYSGLTRDVGRLFLGKNYQCCECHDHLTVDEYKQRHFQGLHAFLKNTFLADAKTHKVAEKPTLEKVPFASVFTKVPMMTAPALPDGMMLEIPKFTKGDEFAEKPDRKTNNPGVPKFRTLPVLAERLPSAKNPDFARNIVNRVWFLLLGRGLVHPLDLLHKDNPASHPVLLDLLAKEFTDRKFDLKWLIREIVQTKVYQRSSIRMGEAKPESFTFALEKRLSAEQLFAAVKLATESNADGNLRAKFVKAFANQPREPEDEIAPSLKGALFLLHDKDVLELLKPKSGNLVDRVSKIEKPETVADELYLAVLTRKPTAEETTTVAEYLAKHAAKKPDAIGKLVWALLASTEFGVNH